MLNFALGPVMSSDLVLKIGSEQTPYFRTPEFSKITLENEKLMKEMLFADEDSKVIFLTGSGTSGMEATVMNVFTENDKVLIVNGGGFGQRFVDLCKLHNIDCDDIKIDFVNYRYNWLDPAIEENGIRLASPRDIAAMKINAIEGRGTKKDFIDIYFLLQHYSLENILKFYADKYPDNSQFRALMSLTYFEDAEEQFMPEMLVAIDWDRIKSFIIDKVATLSL